MWACAGKFQRETRNVRLAGKLVRCIRAIFGTAAGTLIATLQLFGPRAIFGANPQRDNARAAAAMRGGAESLCGRPDNISWF